MNLTFVSLKSTFISESLSILFFNMDNGFFGRINEELELEDIFDDEEDH